MHRVAAASFIHETNTFAIEQNDSMDCAQITRGTPLVSEASSRSCIGGFAEVMSGTDVELVPTVGISFIFLNSLNVRSVYGFPLALQ